MQPDFGMFLHFGEFLRSQLAWLEQDVVRNTDLPDVMQQRSHFQYTQVSPVPPQLLSHPDRQQRHSTRVLKCLGIPKIQG